MRLVQADAREDVANPQIQMTVEERVAFGGAVLRIGTACGDMGRMEKVTSHGDAARLVDAGPKGILRCVGEIADPDRLREALCGSRLMDITEYGRMVHAEMEALLSCARNNMSSREATLYCTTFPCHNCGKHIVAAGVRRVVYVEPYPKSKAAEFHDDSISLGFAQAEGKVHFEPFVGVGPRRFFDLFTLRLGSGYPLKRKDSDGKTIEWKPENSRLRIQMLPCSYLELELLASSMFNDFRKTKDHDDGH